MAVPLGFEEFTLEEVGEKLCYESIDFSKKELTLIAAPPEFDIQRLKGQTFIENGNAPLPIVSGYQDEGDVLQWEVHATSATCDKHLNLLLPSTQKEHKLVPHIDINLNIVRSIKLPHIKYPKKRKTITQLPKPDDLRVRWKPFGSRTPLGGPTSDHEASKISHTMRNNKAEKIKQENAPRQSDRSVNETLTSNKTKKNNDGTVKEPDSTVNKEEDSVSKKKKKRKKKKKNNGGTVENENGFDRVVTKVEHSITKKKRKDTHSKTIDSDLDSEIENKIFGLECSKKRKKPLDEDNDLQNEGVSKKKKKKKKKEKS